VSFTRLTGEICHAESSGKAKSCRAATCQAKRLHSLSENPSHPRWSRKPSFRD